MGIPFENHCIWAPSEVFWPWGTRLQSGPQIRGFLNAHNKDTLAGGLCGKTAHHAAVNSRCVMCRFAAQSTGQRVAVVCVEEAPDLRAALQACTPRPDYPRRSPTVAVAPSYLALLYPLSGVVSGVICGRNEHVVSNICQQCPPSSYRLPGDDPSGPNTTCHGMRCPDPTDVAMHGPSVITDMRYVKGSAQAICHVCEMHVRGWQPSANASAARREVIEWLYTAGGGGFCPPPPPKVTISQWPDHAPRHDGCSLASKYDTAGCCGTARAGREGLEGREGGGGGKRFSFFPATSEAPALPLESRELDQRQA